MTPGYDARIARAEFLIGNYPFAAEILTYYTRICAAQKKLRGELERVLKKKGTPGSAELREQIDVDVVAPHARGLLENLEKHSPRPLGEFITEFLGGSEARRAVALQDYVSKGGTDQPAADSREQLVAAILVQPYAELLAAKQTTPPAVIEGNLCPKCAARPVTGVLRVEGDGGKRFLLCSFCGTEWEFRRIFCAYCAETREGSLPVFVAEKFPHLRMEACDTCRRCLRTVDLTKDGNAIPVVDDLAAVPLALWAEEYGYARIHNNLLGT
jgi:formate dehydrogenase accessory protein FdhE